MNEIFLNQGAVSWTELMTTDVAAAKKFYGTLFGWKFQEFPMGDMVYHVVKVGDREIGGIMEKPPEAKDAPPHWMSYVTVDNVDETAKNAKEMGAKIILPPRDIPDVGRFCVIQDGQGAHLAAITYIKKES